MRNSLDNRKEIREILNELAIKYNITYSQALEIVSTEFIFLKGEITKGRKEDINTYTKSIWLQYLCRFTFKENSFKAIERKIKEGLIKIIPHEKINYKTV